MHAQIAARSLPPTRRRAVLVPVPEHQHRPGPVDLEVVVPVYNEERALALSIRRLHQYLTESVSLSWRILIADNGSTDATAEIAQSLAPPSRMTAVLRHRASDRGPPARHAHPRGDR